jgi:hypothetical protein
MSTWLPRWLFALALLSTVHCCLAVDTLVLRIIETHPADYPTAYILAVVDNTVGGEILVSLEPYRLMGLAFYVPVALNSLSGLINL